MGEHKLKARQTGALSGSLAAVAPPWNYRVIEWPNGKLAIRRVTYDAPGGNPVFCSGASPQIKGRDGDELLLMLNALAEALTKPSLLESEVEMPS